MPRVLVIAPNWIGDALMAQPLLSRLKQSGATIDVLAPEWVAPVLHRMPEVDEVIAAPFRHGALQLGERWRLGLGSLYADAEVVRFFNAPTTTRLFGRTRLPAGNEWRGNVAVRTGPVAVAGRIQGSLVVVNGDVALEPGAHRGRQHLDHHRLQRRNVGRGPVRARGRT